MNLYLYCVHCWTTGAPEPAVTVYHGDALCRSHVREALKPQKTREQAWQEYDARTGVAKPMQGSMDWNDQKEAFVWGWDAHKKAVEGR